MRTNTKHKLFWCLSPLAIGLLVPSLVILCLEVFVGHISLFTAATDILRRQFAKGHNLFLLALFGLIPFAVLSVACLIASVSPNQRGLYEHWWEWRRWRLWLSHYS
jgi:hypothetical protein